ncbi:type VI secretion system baseplate subunit TssG [Massilia niabensis]|uniref:Type VI secretion system baseplate subunit TssG n=1 Tax=Massilia niabensis TaxID=544910 RepID=A0ABW0KZN3_9BURK
MRSTHRRATTRLIDRLLAAPQEFEFIQAVRILLAWLAGQGVAPAQALQTRLRFDNSLRLGFPAAEIEALSRTPIAVGDSDVAGFTITPSFMGLLGGHGALPLHVTERIAAWQLERDDHAPRAFLDLLSGRMLALYYRAWHKHRIEHCSEQAGTGQADALLPRLAALARVPRARRGDGAALPDALFAHFAGMLQQRPVSAAVLERLLASFFRETVRLEEAVGHWDVLAAGEQPALGVNAHLGENTLLGERSWRPDLRARLRIGPLGGEAFARFLPGGSAAAALHAILQAVAEPTVGFEVQLVLRGLDVSPSRLAGAQPAAARLGRDSFLVGTDAGGECADRTDMRYLVMPMAPLRPLPALPAKKRQTRGP